MAKTLPGEFLTEQITAQLVENSHSIQTFMECLTDEQKRRFVELAHNFVFIGFQAYEARTIPAMVEFDKERRAEQALSREMSVYAMGIRDHSRLMEEGEI